MRLFIRRTLSILLAAALSAALVGCDDNPTSVQDFDIQPNIELSRTQLVFVAGQSPPPSFEITYQGIDSVPSVQATGSLTVTQDSETGSPQNGGSATFTVSYDGFVEENTDEGEIMITTTRGDREITKTVSVQVNNPVSVFAQFSPRFAGVADYEDDERTVATSSGASAAVQSDVVAASSNGLNALEVNSPSGGVVTMEREANLPDADIFTFLLKPDASTDFTLTLPFTEEANGEPVSYDLEVPVESGSEWREYAIAAGQLFGDFNPVGEQNGGNGLLQSISFSSDADVTYHLDEMGFGSSEGAVYEIADFEQTTNAYGSFSAIEITDTDEVGPGSDGPTARRMTWTEGGNFFGYNYDRLFFDASNGGTVSLLIGDVSRTFDLWVFVETVDDDGRAGGYSFNNGTTVEVEAGESFRTVSVPLNELGEDASALNDPGVVNVGFEIRRTSSDDSTEPISFVIDNIRLQGAP